MNWLASFFAALLSGVLGLFCAAGIAAFCAKWYRISSFEGKSGYFLVFTALIGALAGFVVGLIAARLMAAGASPTFLKSLGVALGAVLGISLVALGICRLGADIAPRIDGHHLALEIEVRCPKNFNPPKTVDESGSTAGVYVPGGRYQPTAPLQLDQTTRVDGFLIVTATVPLNTSTAKKYLEVRFSREISQSFGLPTRPKREWSEWFESGWEVGKPEPAKEEKFHARSRVVLVEPPPPAPDPGDVVAKEFAALTPAAPLEQWLTFLFNEPTPERTAAVAAQINARQSELAKLIASDDATVREHALHGAAYPLEPVPELVEAVLAEGRTIAAVIRACNELKPDDQEFSDALVDLRSRFDDWKQAWWAIHQRLGVDGRPPVKEIHELAKVRAAGTAMGEIEVGARVILEQMEKMTTKKKP